MRRLSRVARTHGRAVRGRPPLALPSFNLLVGGPLCVFLHSIETAPIASSRTGVTSAMSSSLAAVARPGIGVDQPRRMAVARGRYVPRHTLGAQAQTRLIPFDRRSHGFGSGAGAPAGRVLAIRGRLGSSELR